MSESTKLPTIFWVIAIVGLIWNLLGVMAWIGQISMTPEALAQLPEEQQTIYTSIPSWINIVYGAAVISGVLGCIGLLLKKSWAVQVFLGSLIAIIIQFGYSIFMTDAISLLGMSVLFMSLLVIGIALYLYYYSRQCKSKGWLD